MDTLQVVFQKNRILQTPLIFKKTNSISEFAAHCHFIWYTYISDLIYQPNLRFFFRQRRYPYPSSQSTVSDASAAPEFSLEMKLLVDLTWHCHSLFVHVTPCEHLSLASHFLLISSFLSLAACSSPRGLCGTVSQNRTELIQLVRRDSELDLLQNKESMHPHFSPLQSTKKPKTLLQLRQNKGTPLKSYRMCLI